MIAVVGKPETGLKRLLLENGFPHLANVVAQGDEGELKAVINCSYSTQQMIEKVYHRWPWAEGVPTLNKKLVTNKREQLGLLSEAGVFVPIWVGNPSEVESPEKWILKRVYSGNGRGIQVWNGRSLQHNEYLQQKIEKLREFRAHVALWLPEGERVFSIQEKRPKPELVEQVGLHLREEEPFYDWPDPELAALLPLCWNIRSGFYYRRSTLPEDRAEKRRRFPLFGRIEDIGEKAVRTQRYQFGAVDIIMDGDRELYVLEVNSHPGVKNPPSRGVYSEVFNKLREIEDFRGVFSSTRTITLRRR